MWLTLESSGLPTTFHCHLPLLFHTAKSWIHNHLSQVRADPNPSDWQVLHQICHLYAHSKHTDTSWSTATLPMQPPKLWPRMHIQQSSVTLEAAQIRTSRQFHVSISILWKTAVNCPCNAQRVYIVRYVTNLLLPITGNLHGRHSHLSPQSAKSNIMMMSAMGFWRTNSVISISESGWNRL